MSITLSEEEQRILDQLSECGDAGGYTLVWPTAWPGVIKFKMVSLWGEKGAVLYHKLRKGFEEAIAAGTHEGRTHKASQEQRITVKRNEGGTFTVDKIERLLKRGHHNSEHRINWRQLALEAKSSQRTVTPPTHLFIRGHSRFEGKKLANLLFTGRQSRSKKAQDVHKSKATGFSMEMIGELLRTLAYTAERESQVSVDYAILEDDVFKPMANNSVLQELGKDIHSYIERTVMNDLVVHTKT